MNEKPFQHAFNQELPQIITENKEICNGQIIKQEYIQVKGKTLKEVKKIYDKLKSKK